LSHKDNTRLKYVNDRSSHEGCLHRLGTSPNVVVPSLVIMGRGPAYSGPPRPHGQVLMWWWWPQKISRLI